jgi:hypothetical protein
MTDSDCDETKKKFIPDYEEDIPSTPILGSTSKTSVTHDVMKDKTT